jgi:virginiamycin A acetyltransferase
MPIIRTIIDKLMTRLVCRDEYQSLALRRYFERTYGIKIGLYTFGAFDRWRIPPNSTIGRYCSFAHTARLIDANHPMGALSTHPVFYLKDFGVVDEDLAKLQPTIVEDDVWLSHNCTITPGCQRIGRGAVIGAGAVVTTDVPPYAIMVGMPAKLVRYRFPPDIIEAIEATEWWTLDKQDLATALRQAPGFATSPTREGANLFLRAVGRAELPTAPLAAVRRGPSVQPA